jgi:hypothetical protein
MAIAACPARRAGAEAEPQTEAHAAERQRASNAALDLAELHALDRLPLASVRKARSLAADACGPIEQPPALNRLLAHDRPITHDQPATTFSARSRSRSRWESPIQLRNTSLECSPSSGEELITGGAPSCRTGQPGML